MMNQYGCNEGNDGMAKRSGVSGGTAAERSISKTMFN